MVGPFGVSKINPVNGFKEGLLGPILWGYMGQIKSKLSDRCLLWIGFHSGMNSE
jgi:hypothetical protein